MEVPQWKKKTVKLKTYKQTSLKKEWLLKAKHFNEPKPFFINNRELCVASGKDINIYNPIGGGLLKVLHGHKSKVISLWKSQDLDSEGNETLVSCDAMGNILSWYRNENKNIFSLSAEGEEKFVVTFCNARNNFYTMAILNPAEGDALPILYLISSLPRKTVLLTSGVSPEKNTIAHSYDGKHFAAIKLGELFVASLSDEALKVKERRYHNTGRYQLTSVVFHPCQCVLATSDKTGIVWLWYEIMNRIPTKIKLHWHTLNPGDLCFSPTGTDLYSAGEECVVVRWHLRDRNRKSFLPRLGMPIRYLAVDPTASLLSILHNDLSVSVLDIREMKLEGSIERLAAHVPIENYPPLSAGLLFHPPTSSIVKNGRTGHLQFFNPTTNKVTYNLDITMTNLLNKERYKSVANVDVTKAAMSDDGTWLVTSEACKLTSSLNDIVFKFWFYNKATQKWIFNTHVQTPHTDIVNDLSFLPTQCVGYDELLCASCSEDSKLKLWRLTSYEDVRGRHRNHWSSHATVEFRGLPATACNFSPDGSLLAVAFDSVLTLWKTEDTSLLGSLSQPFLSERILDVSFGHGELGGSSLVSRSEGYLCSWDLLSCSLLWRVFLHSTCLAVDTHSPLMAIFSKENEVFFFDPRSSQPVSSSSDLCSAEVLCSTFVPENDKRASLNGCTSLVHCFDSAQFYFTINPSSLSGEEEAEEVLTSAQKKLSERTEHPEEEESKLYSALMAKSRKVTHPTTKEEETRFSLVAPSINGLVKDLHDLRIHTISFTGLASHLGTFLPDLSYKDDVANEEHTRALTYRTIKDDEMEESRQLKEADQLASDEERLIKSLQKFDFGHLVQQTLHS